MAPEFDLQLQSEDMLTGGGKEVRDVEEFPWKGLVLAFGVEIFCGKSKWKCGKRGCKGMKKALEFDLQLQSEEMLRRGGKVVREAEELPWKGGSEGNGDYECLRSELRKMAPVNGRAVLLFRLKCGCAVAKLEGWGPKRGRRNRSEYYCFDFL
ncbi:ribosomal protein L34e superfamily protein [Artemisia annua]|uniref:Ribosomal protein L34e superfamily protein n=1 Tax=Artemisia annua TaxID=35608 RepID=A0A2U1MZ61_ARTAN|nr:ribosomal protein L34e superfamily protein [Artemisia annua]